MAPRRIDRRDWEALLRRYGLPDDLLDPPPRQLMLFDAEASTASDVGTRSDRPGRYSRRRRRPDYPPEF